jgi:hypothetical protein
MLAEYNELDEQAFNDTLEGLQGEMEFRHKDIASLIKNFESDLDQIDGAIVRMKERKDKVSLRIESLKKFLLESMIKNKIVKHKFVEFDISLRRSDRVVITNLEAIPEEYLRRKEIVEPNKVAIKDYLKSYNTQVPGAILEEFQSLQIK